MGKLKVCLITQEPYKTIRLHQVAQSLLHFGYSVIILQPKFNPRFKPRTVSAALRYLVMMLQVLLARADIYYVFNNPDIGFPAIFKGGRFVYDVRNPWGAEVYDSTGQESIARICEWIEQVLTRRADVVVAVNSRLAERAKRWGARRIVLVPNYPVPSFRPTLTRGEMQERNGLTGKRIVLFTGNFAKVECALDLVKLFPKVLSKVDDAVLVMVGDGPQKSSMEQFVRDFRLENVIRIFARVPRTDVPNWLAMAHVVAVPRESSMRSSYYYCPEGIWKVTEALWMGKPVVTGTVGGFVGTTLPIRTAPLDKFHEAIIQILEDPPELLPFKEFSWDYSEQQLKQALSG